MEDSNNNRGFAGQDDKTPEEGLLSKARGMFETEEYPGKEREEEPEHNSIEEVNKQAMNNMERGLFDKIRGKPKPSEYVDENFSDEFEVSEELDEQAWDNVDPRGDHSRLPTTTDDATNRGTTDDLKSKAGNHMTRRKVLGGLAGAAGIGGLAYLGSQAGGEGSTSSSAQTTTQSTTTTTTQPTTTQEGPLAGIDSDGDNAYTTEELDELGVFNVLDGECEIGDGVIEAEVESSYADSIIGVSADELGPQEGKEGDGYEWLGLQVTPASLDGDGKEEYAVFLAGDKENGQTYQMPKGEIDELFSGANSTGDPEIVPYDGNQNC